MDYLDDEEITKIKQGKKERNKYKQVLLWFASLCNILSLITAMSQE
jgi:hypothetical protein